MAIKDLLVAFDGNQSSESALQFAVQMATKYGASITGVYIYHEVKYESHVRRWIPENVVRNLQETELSAARSIEKQFQKAIKKSGFGGKTKWISSPGRADVLMPRYVRYFDMLIVGQFSAIEGGEDGALHPEELLLRSGKPVITVPTSYTARPFKEEAAVAWDGSRTAARALTDAMQILETKSKIEVIRLVSTEADEAKRVLPEHDLIAHLEAHGINASLAQPKPKGRKVGKTILEHCKKIDPDILVMGAYGRGKFGTLLFGSTAQYVLKNMTLPVLMSH